MKNLQSKVFAVVTSICMLAIASSCGGGGGGGMGGSSGANGAEIVPASDVSSSNNTSYGFSKNSIVISANSGTSVLKTPLYAQNAKVQSIKANTSAKGAGIYSEALKQMGITQTNLLLTIDGVTTEYNFSPSDTLVLKQVAPGTKVVTSGTVQTGKRTCNIVQKEYDIEAFQESLPLFIEYNATLKDKDGNDHEKFVYSTDKPIELPVLNDVTVQDATGAPLGVAPFLGWQVSAPGLSIDKNFYPKGATVPAGELCGDIEFYADYGFCVWYDNASVITVIEDAGIEIFKGDNSALYFVDVNGTATTLKNANVTNPAVATFAKDASTGIDTLTPKTVGNTTFTVTGKSLRGNNYTVQIPVVVDMYTKIFIKGRKVEIYATWCSPHEVTQGEYQAVMGSNPCSSSNFGVGDNYPVHYVTWYKALVYCNKRSIKENLTPCYTINGSTNPDDWGTPPFSVTSSDATWDAVTCNFNANGYRLPTEAEWEHFARAERKESYLYSGSDDVDEVAWYDDNSSTKTHEVGKKKPNGAGLYDMSGNVWEWCWDWYVYSITTSTPSTGSTSGNGRVIRGGCLSEGASSATFSSRYYIVPYDSRPIIGFRVVRSAK